MGILDQLLGRKRPRGESEVEGVLTKMVIRASTRGAHLFQSEWAGRTANLMTTDAIEYWRVFLEFQCLYLHIVDREARAQLMPDRAERLMNNVATSVFWGTAFSRTIEIPGRVISPKFEKPDPTQTALVEAMFDTLNKRARRYGGCTLAMTSLAGSTNNELLWVFGHRLAAGLKQECDVPFHMSAAMCATEGAKLLAGYETAVKELRGD